MSVRPSDKRQQHDYGKTPIWQYAWRGEPQRRDRHKRSRCDRSTKEGALWLQSAEGVPGTVCGLYEASDTGGGAKQVGRGFAESFVRALSERGGLGPMLKYGKNWIHVHDPLVWCEVADAMLRNAGEQVVLHSVVTNVLTENDRIEGAVGCAKDQGGRVDGASDSQEFRIHLNEQEKDCDSIPKF